MNTAHDFGVMPPWPREHHCPQCCRWCWEESCYDVAEYVVFPPADLARRSPTVAEYARISHAMPERQFVGHCR